MALPAIRDVRRHFADAHLVVAARQPVATLFRAAPGIDEITAPDKIGGPNGVGGDVGVLLPNSFRSAWLLKRAGVQERWGYRSDLRSMLLTKGVRRPRKRVHFAEYYQHLVRSLGIETGPRTAQLSAPKPRVDAAATLLAGHGWTPGQTLVGIAPGAAFGHAKRWPPDRYAALAASLKSDLGVTCVVLGRSEDRDAGEHVKGIDLIGKTDLLTLMGVLSHCSAVVANDSGALHLAAALGVPVTAIYGPTHERYSLPVSPEETPGSRVRFVSHDVFCRPCFMRDCPIDHRCMKGVGVEQVFEAVRAQLEAPLNGQASV
jgi:heptosyltransferase-2